MEQSKWGENVILVDAGYLDRVAFDLIVNFERMLDRRIPPADLCHWLDCIALDGGLQPGPNGVQVVFIHPRATTALRHFTPAQFATELDGQAFSDNLGEFELLSFPVEEVVEAEDFFMQSLAHLLEVTAVKRLMVVADMENYGERVRRTVGEAKDKEVTLFAMEPLQGCGFHAEILGYSLMSALGIRGDELH